MNNVCRFCKVHFPTEKADNSVCDACRDEVKKTVQNDERMKLDFLEAVLKDEIAIERIAKALFEVPARNVGIGGDGSLADFFRHRTKTNTRRSNS